MKRECILSENELNKKRKIIQRNKIKKILNEAEQLSRDEMEALDHGRYFYFCSYLKSWKSCFHKYKSKFRSRHILTSLIETSEVKGS